MENENNNTLKNVDEDFSDLKPNKKAKILMIVLIIFFIGLIVAIGIIIYPKLFNKAPITNNDPIVEPNKPTDPVIGGSEDENTNKENEKVENEVINTKDTIRYISIEKEKEKFNNLEKADTGFAYSVGSDNKIYYDNNYNDSNDEEENVVVADNVLLTDPNNNDVKSVYFDEMSSILYVLKNDGTIYIGAEFEDGEDDILFESVKLVKSDIKGKVTDMYFYSYPPGTECEMAWQIVLEVDNKIYIFSYDEVTNKYILSTELNEEFFNKQQAEFPGCVESAKFYITISMTGKIKYLSNIDARGKALLDADTKKEITASRLIHTKNTAYVIDTNNNLYKITSYLSGYTKIGTVKDVAVESKEDDTYFPDSIVINLTTGKSISIIGG